MAYDTNKFAPVWIKKETKSTLADMKIHPNQSYDELVCELIMKANQYDKYCDAVSNDCR